MADKKQNQSGEHKKVVVGIDQNQNRMSELIDNKFGNKQKSVKHQKGIDAPKI